MTRSFIEGFRCLGCRRELPWGKIRYACPSCGSNLEVVYDYASLRRKLRPNLLRTRGWVVGRYRELLPLEKEPSFPLPIGPTPLLRAPTLERQFGCRNVYLKDDTRNPSASFKDRASQLVLLRAAEEKASVVAAASTGNAGASLACLSAATGQTSVIFVPKRAPKPKLAQLQIFGAKVVAVDGTYDDAFDLCAEVCRAYGWYNRNTGLNPFTREGKKTVAYEIFEQLIEKGRSGCPDWVLVPTGDGNIISGVGKGFKDLVELGWIPRMPRLVAVQARGSNAIARTWQRRKITKKTGQWVVEKIEAKTRADSISVDLPRDAAGALKVLEESKGTAVEVSDEEIFSAQSFLARTTGIFAEPSAAASVAGLRVLSRRGIIGKSDTVVCLVTGNGLKDVQFVLERLAAPPVVAPRFESVKKLMARFRVPGK